MITVLAPLRLELAGGWSDTPPYCLENGGAVLNAAIKLDGVKPICVTAEKDDIVTVAPYESELALCAVRAAGIDGGVRLSCISPGGSSGLGTSSILIAAIIKAIWLLYHRDHHIDELFNAVLTAEKMMGVGGGWQDQVGGVVPGLKLTTTTPGDQYYTIHKLSHGGILKDALLYDTGYLRNSGDIVKHIMGKYMIADKNVAWLIGKNKRLAVQMMEAIRDKSRHDFRSLLNEVWTLHCDLCPDICSPRIQDIIDTIVHLCDAYRIVGAGNGGYLFMMPKSEEAAGDIKMLLAKRDLGGFVDFEIDNEGMTWQDETDLCNHSQEFAPGGNLRSGTGVA